MRIPNPFANHPHTRVIFDDAVMVVGPCDSVEVNDDTELAVIEAVNVGRSDADVVYAARVWTQADGLMGQDTYEKKVKIELEAKKLEKDQQAFAARQRAEKEAKKREKIDAEYAEKDRKAREEDKTAMEIAQALKEEIRKSPMRMKNGQPTVEKAIEDKYGDDAWQYNKEDGETLDDEGNRVNDSDLKSGDMLDMGDTLEM